ncbi:MAG: HAMP domain-containing histidine kinase [Leptolyngbyaceae cyanobacterium SL_7_1]|nr:HAMP domain-containing histidine kinase [Leptolyngbyaceae cyanobacterium SL_7_1]
MDSINIAATQQEPTPLDRPWWKTLLGEARTRILLLYILLMTLITGLSIPVFLSLLFAEVDDRVNADLAEEMERFRTAYRDWEQRPNQSIEDFKQYIDEFFNSQRPEDDNFLLIFLEGELYRSNPQVIPNVLQPGTDLTDRWLRLETATMGSQPTDDPDLGKVLYLVQPLVFEGSIQGVFITAHTTAGEREEAFAGVIIFIKVALGVVSVSFVLAWLTTGQLLVPVQRLAAATQSIATSGDLSQRVSVSGSGELVEMATTFNAMMQQLQTAFTSQRNFINDAGHELRTPITIIRGHLELLGDDPQEQRETLELVLDELDRMGRLVNELILLVKSERPDFLHLETIDVRSFTEEVFAKAQALADRQWQLSIRGSGKMVGDRQRLTGALINLAQNATQHTQPHDLITIGSIVTSHAVQFWVRDAGEGIDLDDQQRIFERFARAANSYRRSDGSGLGLAIVRAIVEAHGGQIELVSQPGSGSTFTLVLPLEPLKEQDSL